MPFTKIVYYIKYLSIISIFITSVFLMYNEYKNANDRVDAVIDRYHQDNLLLISGYFKQFENNSVKIYNLFFDDELLNIIVDADKEKFDAMASEFYAKYLLNEPSLWGMDMILSNGSLLTHIHSCDSMVDFDYQKKLIAQKALQSRKLQSGFEHDSAGYFYKIVYPIFFQSKFLEFVNSLIKSVDL